MHSTGILSCRILIHFEVGIPLKIVKTSTKVADINVAIHNTQDVGVLLPICESSKNCYGLMYRHYKTRNDSVHRAKILNVIITDQGAEGTIFTGVCHSVRGVFQHAHGQTVCIPA